MCSRRAARAGSVEGAGWEVDVDDELVAAEEGKGVDEDGGGAFVAEGVEEDGVGEVVAGSKIDGCGEGGAGLAKVADEATGEGGDDDAECLGVGDAAQVGIGAALDGPVDHQPASGGDDDGGIGVRSEE